MKLENFVKDQLKLGLQPSAIKIGILSSYKPLYDYKLTNLSPFSNEIYKRQFEDIKEETILKNNISSFKNINNNISSSVKKQYEDNPYPRWIKTAIPSLSPCSIESVCKETKLNIHDEIIYKTKSPKILIAGCGTGQHSIGTSSRFRDSEVLAVDLSLSSLAYAERKTFELGINNIEYVQSDILNLDKLDKKFDIIESSGVLHHMENPIIGWETLVNLLKSGGLMKIGLYSELARKNIIRIRNEIKELKINSDEDSMREFRKKIIFSSSNHHKQISLSHDFYSLSNFRDLLFHVTEHRFSLIEIKQILNKLNLKFCGFEDSSFFQIFKSKYPNRNDIYDLNKWDEFEKENPYIFSGMYQFWCQKIV